MSSPLQSDLREEINRSRFSKKPITNRHCSRLVELHNQFVETMQKVRAEYGLGYEYGRNK